MVPECAADNLTDSQCISQLKLFKNLINPLLPNGNYSYYINKISLSKKERIRKKISYELRVYESVDDESLSKARSQNLTGKWFQAVMG